MASIEEFKKAEAEYKAAEEAFRVAKAKAAETEIELLVLYKVSFLTGYPKLWDAGHGHSLEEIDALIPQEPTHMPWLYVVKKQRMSANGTVTDSSDTTGFFKDRWQDCAWHSFDSISPYPTDGCFSIQTTEKRPEGWKEWKDYKDNPDIEPLYIMYWSDNA
jgi:hypothetical protein